MKGQQTHPVAGGAFRKDGQHVARALTLAPANLVSPFQYFQLFASVIVGYLFFAALPDAATWIGAGIIMVSGLYIGWTQTRVAKQGSTP